MGLDWCSRPVDAFLLLLKAITPEAQRAAVFCHRPHNLLWHAIGNLSLNFERNFDLGTQQLGQVLNHLIGDLRGVTPNT